MMDQEVPTRPIPGTCCAACGVPVAPAGTFDEERVQFGMECLDAVRETPFNELYVDVGGEAGR